MPSYSNGSHKYTVQDKITYRRVQEAHSATVPTRLSKGLSFLAMRFPRKDYSANKFIAYGKKCTIISHASQEGPEILRIMIISLF